MSPKVKVTTTITWPELLEALEKFTWKGSVAGTFDPKEFCERDILELEKATKFLIWAIRDKKKLL